MNWIYETNDDNSARFALGQVFDTSGKTLICFGINPSTACPSCLDNTIRKLIAISKNNGYDNWIMLNVYPQRATNPNQLHEQCNESLIAHNLQSIQQVLDKYPNSDVLLAYGNLITKRKFLLECLNDILIVLTQKYDKKLKIISVTKSGNPVHPLYQSNCSQLCDYFYEVEF